MSLAWLPVALLAWLIQYAVFLPLYVLWRALAFAFKLGLVGVLLLFLPVIGWIALLVWWLAYRGDRRDRRTREVVTGRSGSVLRPWLLDRLAA